MKRIIIPDSHGHLIDKVAKDAAISIIRHMLPTEIVLLGDHVDCGGIYSRFERLSKNERYSSKLDFQAAQDFLTEIREAVPRAKIHYLEGNHEAHIERWAINNLREEDDIELYLSAGSVHKRLGLDKLRIVYYRRDSFYHGMASPGVIRLDGCLFTHGLSASKYATVKHLEAYGMSIVHGHTHRAASVIGRRADGEIIEAHCPGTLAILQQLYQHTSVSQHSHGISFQEVYRGKLFHYNISIKNGTYVLP